MKTTELSKIELEVLKRQIKQLHVDSVEIKTGELDRAEEVVTQSNDNVLLQEGTGVIESESESDIMKWLKLLLKNPQNIQFHHCNLRMYSN